jgi:hypothetical protein
MQPPRSDIVLVPEGWAAWLSTISLAVIFVSSVLVEWSIPDCSIPGDGPLYALFGSPFPFITFSGASSMRFNFAPHLFLMDVMLVVLLFAPVVGAVFRRLPRWISRGLGVVAAAALLCAVCWGGILGHVDFLRPTSDISRPPRVTYSSMRPVGVAFGVHYDCTPMHSTSAR